jgi:hypothetical protein
MKDVGESGVGKEKTSHPERTVAHSSAAGAGRALGPTHPRTAATRENLAAVRPEPEGQAAP